jgi:hypothetical protein
VPDPQVYDSEAEGYKLGIKQSSVKESSRKLLESIVEKRKLAMMRLKEDLIIYTPRKTWAMNRKLLVISVIAIVIVVLIVYAVFPKVSLKVDNFHATLEEALIFQGVYSNFVTDANFTITNMGNKDSTSFRIFVDTSEVSRAIPTDSINVEPIKAGETRIIVLEGYSGQGHPKLIINYGSKSNTIHFGDRITIDSFG